MDRAEYRAIVRRILGPVQSTMVSDYEINALINQALRELALELGGEVASTTLSTDTDGFASLAALVDFVRIFRLEYEGVRVSRVSYDEIAELEETT